MQSSAKIRAFLGAVIVIRILMIKYDPKGALDLIHYLAKIVPWDGRFRQATNVGSVVRPS